MSFVTCTCVIWACLLSITQACLSSLRPNLTSCMLGGRLIHRHVELHRSKAVPHTVPYSGVHLSIQRTDVCSYACVHIPGALHQEPLSICRGPEGGPVRMPHPLVPVLEPAATHTAHGTTIQHHASHHSRSSGRRPTTQRSFFTHVTMRVVPSSTVTSAPLTGSTARLTVTSADGGGGSGLIAARALS